MRSINKARNIFNLNKQLVKFQFCAESQASKQVEIDRLSMTPHEYYITQSKAMERPFTGKTWYVKDVGTYHCTSCNAELFSFDQKFQTNDGMANFWNHKEGAVNVVDIQEGDVNCKENLVNLSLIESELKQEKDLKRCECKGCGSHLGLAYFDGPPPTFMRYSINAASAYFKVKPNWEDPNIAIQQKNEQKRKEKQQKRQAEL